MGWSCPLRFVATLHFQKDVVYRRLQHAMSHAGLFGSWHLAPGEAEECYGFGCSPSETHSAVADGGMRAASPVSAAKMPRTKWVAAAMVGSRASDRAAPMPISH